MLAKLVESPGMTTTMYPNMIGAQLIEFVLLLLCAFPSGHQVCQCVFDTCNIFLAQVANMAYLTLSLVRTSTTTRLSQKKNSQWEAQIFHMLQEYLRFIGGLLCSPYILC